MTTQQDIRAPFVGYYGDLASGLPGGELPWLTEMRRDGIETFGEMGFPNPKVEDWKYTRLKPLEDTQFKPTTAIEVGAGIEKLPTLLAGDAAAARLVFVNGGLRTDLSRLDDLPDGLEVTSLGDVLASDPAWAEQYLGRIASEEVCPLRALNTAMMQTGAVIRVRKGVVIEAPVEIVFVSGLTANPVAYHPRNLIVLEDGSQLTLVKYMAGGLGVGPYFANSVSEVSVGAGAILRHYRVQEENLEATNLQSLNVRVGRDATYEGFGLSIGGRLSRMEAHVRLEGEGGHCSLNGVYMMRGREHCDNTTVIEHLVPNTSCREVFKGVLDDESRGVFQGRIVVHKDAQHTDGHQLSKALLMSNKAEMDAKPELEIYADDVKCSHGATTGELDETSLFYLRSRGIPETYARNLLIQSFLSEALQEMSSPLVRDAMADKIVHWLPGQCFLASEWRDA